MRKAGQDILRLEREIRRLKVTRFLSNVRFLIRLGVFGFLKTSASISSFLFTIFCSISLIGKPPPPLFGWSVCSNGMTQLKGITWIKVTKMFRMLRVSSDMAFLTNHRKTWLTDCCCCHYLEGGREGGSSQEPVKWFTHRRYLHCFILTPGFHNLIIPSFSLQLQETFYFILFYFTHYVPRFCGCGSISMYRVGGSSSCLYWCTQGDDRSVKHAALRAYDTMLLIQVHSSTLRESCAHRIDGRWFSCNVYENVQWLDVTVC